MGCCLLSDVLILRQFMREDGKIIDFWVSGLCKRQHMRMNKLIRMAQRAGLFPKELDQYRRVAADYDILYQFSIADSPQPNCL